MEKMFYSVLERMKSYNKYEEHIKNFKTLRTDEERIIFTLNIMLEYNIIPEACSDIKYARQSQILREMGNAMFVSTPQTSETCVSALKLYTASIAYAPCPSEQLTLAYANRSAVLMKFCKYEECIRDIDRAFALSYPENLKFKLYLRKAVCLKALQNSGLQDTIKEAEQWLERVSLDERLRKEINGKLMSIKRQPNSHKSKERNAINHRSECPLPTIQTRNIEIPCATDAVTINYNKQYGRHVVATRKINPGEIIAIEKPYSWILHPDNVHTHCSYCLEVSWANIPCDYCVHAMYCSEECKASDWKQFHDIECSVFPFLFMTENIKFDLFSLRLSIQVVRESSSLQELREELKKIDNCDDPRTKGFSENGTWESNKYRSLLSLQTNTEKLTPNNLFQGSIDACFILYILATRTNIFGSPLKDLFALTKNADVSFVGSLILRHQQLIACSGHSFSEEYELNLVERGIVVMPFRALYNHSCVPNIKSQSRSKHMVSYAIYPIEKGEQLCDNYNYTFGGSPKVIRQKALLEQYYFKCQCIACEENWPLLHDTKSFRELVKTEEDKNKIYHVLRKFKSYFDLTVRRDVTDKPHIIDDLLQMIKVLYDLVPMPCREIIGVGELLKRVYDLYGNIREIPVLQAMHSP